MMAVVGGGGGRQVETMTNALRRDMITEIRKVCESGLKLLVYEA
jgi:hypothetical protein